MKKRIVFWLVGVWAYLGGMLTTHAAPAEDWRTKAERTDYRETDPYAETMAYCRRLAAASEFVHAETIGTSPEGREILALVVSLDQAFTPEAARATGKEIVLVNCCIHPGECEGKDASLALIRDLVIDGQSKTDGLLDHAILLVIPVHGVDGYARFGPFNRINQNGPAEMGWRTTAQNYNLNRDWVKADAPEMRAELDLFHRWLPDILIDTHTTDGADYQYDLTYTLERFGNQDAAVRAWQAEAFDGHIFPELTRMGHKIAPYVVFNNPGEPKEGFNDDATKPRFSTGYAAAWNRVGLLVETHMLKDYRNRVTATYDLLKSILEEIRRAPGTLRHATEQADRETVAAGKTFDPARRVPLDFKHGPGSVPFDFLGVEYHHEVSPISGALWIKYDNARPVTFTVPFFNEVLPAKEVNPPLGYLVPAAWTVVLERLRDHGIAFTPLTKPLTREVDTCVFEHVEWDAKPFENHHAIKDLKSQPARRTMTFPAGSAVVYLDQPAAKLVLHLLEPDGPDSLLRWGYFDAIFEQKEYGEDYVLEPLAREMLARDPKLKEEFEAKLAGDPVFAANAHARLDFFYRRSPYWDARYDVYPIGRIYERVENP